MYVREFPPQMDWQHISEGLSVFNLMGLSLPDDAKLIERTRRFAGFYDGRIRPRPTTTRSTASSAACSTAAAGRCCAPPPRSTGPAIPFDTRKFHLVHGERNFEEFLAHYADYTDTVCDNPLNLQSTTLGAQCLSVDRRERAGASGCCRMSTPGWNAPRPTTTSCPARSGSTDASAAGRAGQVVRRCLRLELQPRRAADRQARGPQPRAALHRRLHECRAADGRRQVHERLAPPERARSTRRRSDIDGKLQTPRMCGPQGWYSYAPGPVSAERLRDLVRRR